MYTWGELKNSIFYKLDLDPTDDEANELGYASRFVAYANEAMTMICSTVKPKRTFYEFEIHNGKYNEFGELIEEGNVLKPITMPDDFISFGDDVNTIDEDIGYGTTMRRKAFEEDFEYHGYNQIICREKGKYSISYNARWHKFTSSDTVLNVPMDILECIPSYVASQCMKTDDEQKSAMLRNEFEILMARIDDTNYKSTETFSIGGDW